MIGSEVQSFLSIPILNPTEKSKKRRTSSFFQDEPETIEKIATNGLENDKLTATAEIVQEAVFVVCLVNKKNGAKFDEKDARLVKDCFQ